MKDIDYAVFRDFSLSLPMHWNYGRYPYASISPDYDCTP